MQSSWEGQIRFRRYRLIVAKKESLRTGPETAKVLQRLDRSLPQCLPGLTEDDYIYGYAADECRSPSSYYAYSDVDGMRLLGSISGGYLIAWQWTTLEDLSVADGTKGSALCGASPSTPSA